MVVSKHTQANSVSDHQTRAFAVAGDVARSGGVSSARELVDQAARLQVRAPELALVFAERAAAVAETAGADELWVHAEGVAVSAHVRLGRRAATVGRAVSALGAAEAAGQRELAARLRVDLAVCARSVGASLAGLGALQPILTATDLRPTHRAAALCHLVGCMPEVGRKPELDRSLAEADRLYELDPTSAAADRCLHRALLRVGICAHRRRHGELTAAADAARTGLGYLDDGDGPDIDGGAARVRLVLQLVCTLLDQGETDAAAEIAQPVFAQPPRAASAGPLGWLHLAVATRIHLPAGNAEAAATLLRDAVYGADRHGLPALTSRLWLELAHIEQRFGRAFEAVESMRKARATEHVHARIRRQACALLVGEFGNGTQSQVDLAEVLAVRVNTPSVESSQRAPETTSQQATAAARSAPEPARQARPSAAVAPATQPEADESPAAVPTPARKTRHDSEHGSVTARSVLDRLGISDHASGGGRRRAAEEEEQVGTSRTDSSTGQGADTAPASTYPPEGAGSGGFASEPDGDHADRPSEDAGTAAEAATGEPDSWLPRVRMPPSLAPIEELDPAMPPVSEEPETLSTSYQHEVAEAASEPMPAPEAPTPQQPRVPAEEPPEDAGLAELLARALAEHQAGSSSAAALVRELGANQDDPAGSRPVNGSSVGGDAASGRHRSDD